MGINALLSETEAMPLRGFAAGISAATAAIAACAFVLAAQDHDFYLAQGKELIPEGRLPKSIRDGANISNDLVERYPNDPRSHFYKAWDFIYQKDLSSADSELHIALTNPAITGGDLPPQFASLVKATLALVLQGEGQAASARSMATEICSDKSLPSGSEFRRSLERQHLCD
jgi:hypothetical protein